MRSKANALSPVDGAVAVARTEGAVRASNRPTHRLRVPVCPELPDLEGYSGGAGVRRFVRSVRLSLLEECALVGWRLDSEVMIGFEGGHSSSWCAL